VVGRVVDGRLVPFEDAGTIAAAPPTDAEVLAYLDPNDLLFLQIQGSGRLVLEDGRVVRAGYAAKNGRPYVAVGKTLVADGAMPLEEVSMQSIEAWLDAAPPEEAARVRHSNPSYVFFRALELEDPSLGPLGAQGLPLTPGRSIAVDRRYYPMGLPVWLATDGTADNPALRRLMIAQDTGGAIRGPVRGDVFYGSDEAAARLAGTMKAEGRLILLLPQGLAARVTGAQAGA
jgi:membrane-bound lytic murein transglycosylase A